MNATFVLDLSALQTNGDHGTYPWFDEMTGISHNEYTLERVKTDYNPDILDICPASAATATIAMPQCNMLFNVTGYKCCSYINSDSEHDMKHNCFIFECLKGLISTFRPLILSKYRYNAQHSSRLKSVAFPAQITIYDDAEYNIAVHIRTGDIRLHVDNTGYFINMIESTAIAHLSHMPVHVYYIGQFGNVSDNTNTMKESPTADWSFLNQLHANTSFYNPDEQTALHHFIQADMTISTGSSFPLIAVALSDKAVYVTAIPKEGVNGYMYDPDNNYTYNLDEHGKLETSQAEAFARAAQQLKIGRFSFNGASVAAEDGI
jgi:hypothetical protein